MASSRNHEDRKSDGTVNNTFLSRVFGMNSSYPNNTPLFADDHETELSLFNDNNLHSDDEFFDNSNHTVNSALNSSEEDNDDGDDDEEGELIPESLMVEHTSNNNYLTHNDPNRFPLKGILLDKKNSDDHLPVSQKAKQLASKTLNKLTGNNNSNNDLLPPPSQMNHKFNKQQRKQEKLLRNKLGILTPLERSLWVWANITNLDIFLNDVYKYYIGKGFQCILIENICNVLTLMFILTLSVFMGNCIDYDILLNSAPTKMSEVRVDKCYSKIPKNQKFLIMVVLLFILLRVKSFLMKELPKLREIKNFYNYLLNINDDELQTISWNSIVKKVMVLRDQNTTAVISENFGLINEDLKSKKRLNAHDIANRIMRKENYMIALFNKNILNLSVPFITKRSHSFLTKTLEWNLNLCIFDFIFDSQTGQLQKKFLKEQNRLLLAKELKNRFILAGILNILLSPFVVTYFILYYFLKFFYEFKANPNLINNREYTPLATWKFREFNELEHLFKKRLSLSDQLASNYINQFPRKKIDIILKFLSFLSGSLLTLLVILTILDPESFLNFEITHKRTVLFYISTLGAVYTICQNSIHDENIVFDPEQNLQKLYKFTHYLPKEWEGRLHTEDVKSEFAKFYNLKIVIILKELLSLVVSPMMLMFGVANSSTLIIDFFRNYSIHVDELGYVCYFAMFNFDKKDKLRSEYYQSNDDKMMKSYLYFIDNINNDENLDHYESSVFIDNSSLQVPSSHHPSKTTSKKMKPSNLRNSYIMEESFESQLLENNNSRGNSSKKSPKGLEDDDDDEEDENDGGVLKFVNQFYSKT